MNDFYEEQQDLTQLSSTSPSDENDEADSVYEVDEDGLEDVNEVGDESEEESEDEEPPQEDLSDERRETVRRIALDAKARAEKGKLQRLQMEGEGFERVQMVHSRSGGLVQKASRRQYGASEESLRLRELDSALATPQRRAVSSAVNANEVARSHELAKARAYAARARDLLQNGGLDDHDDLEDKSCWNRLVSHPLLSGTLRTLLTLFCVISMAVLLWNSKYGDTVQAARIAPDDGILALDSGANLTLGDHEVIRTSAAIESIYQDAKAIFKQVDHDKEWLKFSEDLYSLSLDYVLHSSMLREQPSILNEKSADFLANQRRLSARLAPDLERSIDRYRSASWMVSLWDFWMTVVPIPCTSGFTSVNSVAALIQKYVRTQEVALKELMGRNNEIQSYVKGAKLRRESLFNLIEVELDQGEKECKAKQVYPVVPAGSEVEDDLPPYCKWARPDEVRQLLSEPGVMRAFDVVERFVEGNRQRHEVVGDALKGTGEVVGEVRKDGVYKSMAHPRQLRYVEWVKEKIREESDRF